MHHTYAVCCKQWPSLKKICQEWQDSYRYRLDKTLTRCDLVPAQPPYSVRTSCQVPWPAPQNRGSYTINLCMNKLFVWVPGTMLAVPRRCTRTSGSQPWLYCTGFCARPTVTVLDTNLGLISRKQTAHIAELRKVRPKLVSSTVQPGLIQYPEL